MLVVSALLFALGYWTYSQVERSLREIRANTLQSLLDSGVNALRVWINEEMADAQRLAREARVRESIAALGRNPGCSGASRERLEEVMRPLLRDTGDATFNIVARGGRLLATRFPEYCGRDVSAAFLAELEPVFEGKPRFVRPFRDAERIANPPERLRPGPPFAWVYAPVHEGGKVIAALGIAQPVDAVFGSILASARPGPNGEAFVFDRNASMLTADRFGETAPLGRKPEGVALDAYESHRGVEAIGAWRWLPEHAMGIAIEIEAAEAYVPLRYLNIAFGVVFGALVVAVLAAAASTLSVVRLRSELGGSRKLGAYVLKKVIGEGGMATVYLARHDLLRRPAAVKLLKPARATDEMIARFEREVQMASSLSHPNTVEIFDFGRTRDGLF
ncbi:MAG TPA: hypothetical protein VHI32_01545, partial [Burkholderiales bacterium]|nr:hypothetical protein [Burkholderiales bacterium]